MVDKLMKSFALGLAVYYLPNNCGMVFKIKKICHVSYKSPLGLNIETYKISRKPGIFRSWLLAHNTMQKYLNYYLYIQTFKMASVCPIQL